MVCCTTFPPREQVNTSPRSDAFDSTQLSPVSQSVGAFFKQSPSEFSFLDLVGGGQVPGDLDRHDRRDGRGRSGRSGGRWRGGAVGRRVLLRRGRGGLDDAGEGRAGAAPHEPDGAVLEEDVDEGPEEGDRKLLKIRVQSTILVSQNN